MICSMTPKDVLDTELTEHQSVMAMMGPNGDTKITWDRRNTVEVDVARSAFNKAKAGGHMAYKVDDSGRRGLVLHEFDPAAERIILAPPMQGG